MDDLAERLTELSQVGVPRGSDAIWRVATRRLRRRRRTRGAALALTAAMLVGAVVGVAARDRRNPRGVSAPVQSTTSRATTTTAAPTATEGRLATSIVIPGSERFDPPQPADVPTISAADALAQHRMFGSTSAEVLLARMAHPIPASDIGPLVWLVILNEFYPAGGPTGATGVLPGHPREENASGVMIWIVDARTGHGGVGYGFGRSLTPAELACQDSCVPIADPYRGVGERAAGP